MPADVVIDMPTDLHSTNVHKLELESDTPVRSRGIASLTVSIPSSRKNRDGPSSPSRWRTTEFFFYFLVTAVALPYMAWVPIRLSSRMSIIIQRI